MSPKLLKLASNFSPRHIRTIGVRPYLRLLSLALFKLPAILRSGDLRPIDRAMGTKPMHINFRSRKFTIDCPAVDALVSDGTFTFGIIREIYLRNCYIREGVAAALDSARFVLDLGANRGAFTTMAAATADVVIAVEALPQLVPAIKANTAANGFKNIKIETAFAGSGGAEERADATPRLSVLDLLRKYQLPRFDVVKIDIEGSEFGLFAEPTWLEFCGAICMEVHPASGRVATILEALKRYGFATRIANHTFQPVRDPQHAEFIWAWRDNWTNRPDHPLQTTDASK